MNKYILVVGTLYGLAAGAVWTQTSPGSMPAKDTHDNVTIAADPYQEEARYKERFGKKNPYKVGILAVEVFIRNENDKPIRVNLENVRLLLAVPGAERQRLRPLRVEDVVDGILNKGGQKSNKPRVPIPIPGRGPSTGRGKDWDELETIMRSVAYENDILPPRSTVKGIFFFDMDGHYDWVEYARLYVPDLEFMHNHQGLLYFEVDLAPAVKTRSSGR